MLVIAQLIFQTGFASYYSNFKLVCGVKDNLSRIDCYMPHHNLVCYSLIENLDCGTFMLRAYVNYFRSL